MIRSVSPLRPDSTITGSGVAVPFRFAHPAQDVEPADARQGKVEHHEVGPVVLDLGEGGRAVAGLGDREPVRLELPGHHRPHPLIVVDDQDPGTGDVGHARTPRQGTTAVSPVSIVPLRREQGKARVSAAELRKR